MPLTGSRNLECFYGGHCWDKDITNCFTLEFKGEGLLLGR